jgi:hypothetical protein
MRFLPSNLGGLLCLHLTLTVITCCRSACRHRVLPSSPSFPPMESKCHVTRRFCWHTNEVETLRLGRPLMPFSHRWRYALTADQPGETWSFLSGPSFAVLMTRSLLSGPSYRRFSSTSAHVLYIPTVVAVSLFLLLCSRFLIRLNCQLYRSLRYSCWFDSSEGEFVYHHYTTSSYQPTTPCIHCPLQYNPTPPRYTQLMSSNESETRLGLLPNTCGYGHWHVHRHWHWHYTSSYRIIQSDTC